jgi:flagellar motor protein MotB
MSASDLEDEGGEGYFASVSDLMVGILFVFLLMLTVFALNFRDDQDKQTVARQKYEELLLRTEEQQQKNESLRGLLKRAVALLREEVEGRRAARDRLLTQLGERLKREHLEVLIVPESGVLRLPEQLLFDVGQDKIGVTRRGVADAARLQDARERLARLAAALEDLVPCFAVAEPDPNCAAQDRATLDGVLIEGHSDPQGFTIRGAPSTAKETVERNDQLSMQRALTVFNELRERKALDMMRNAAGQRLFAVSAYGARRPAAGGESEDAYRQNRRIDLRFLLSTRTSVDLQKIIDEITPALREGP